MDIGATMGITILLLLSLGGVIGGVFGVVRHLIAVREHEGQSSRVENVELQSVGERRIRNLG